MEEDDRADARKDKGAWTSVATGWRDLAMRARRLARWLDGEERQTILARADGYEKRARDAEAGHAAPPEDTDNASG